MPPPEPMLQGRWRLVPFTRHDVELLLRAGIIPEDASTELLSGVIVAKDRAAEGEDPLTIGPAHGKCVERLSDLRTRINSPVRHVRSQQPLVCSPTHVPEPDFAIIRGTLNDYSDHPSAADVHCVVEVADASYERDATEKLRGYAMAGVPQYVIINLPRRRAEVYSDPAPEAGKYPAPHLVEEGDVLRLSIGCGEDCQVALSDLLA